MTVNKPSRSDEVLDQDQQLRVADEVRAHFESITPKRPIKPNRSEPDPDADAFLSTHHQAHSETIPELNRLHDLKSQSQTVLSVEGGVPVPEEFVETEYYMHKETVDKQHHTTGTGFIKMGNGNERGQKNEQQRSSKYAGTKGDYKIKSNPATNDWTPSSEGDDQYVYVSNKPSRSG
ncbi:uncharacterized protein LOC141643515 [Silene latifolia]|uniref:uncharacterized protein LOC141643515 n=1 Tax=Silene latifolia TaxID=37657 RepID=UPI003D7766AF